MCEGCFPNSWVVCVTLISLHRDKKGEGWRIRILNLTWLDPPTPLPHPSTTITPSLHRWPPTPSESHSVTWQHDIALGDLHPLSWQHSYISPSNDISFLQWKLRIESCPACEKKEMSKWPRFQLPSQVSPILSPWERGSGDWPSSNQSPLFSLCFSSCAPWQENIRTELTYSCREANQEYRKESL